VSFRCTEHEDLTGWLSLNPPVERRPFPGYLSLTIARILPNHLASRDDRTVDDTLQWPPRSSRSGIVFADQRKAALRFATIAANGWLISWQLRCLLPAVKRGGARQVPPVPPAVQSCARLRSSLARSARHPDVRSSARWPRAPPGICHDVAKPIIMFVVLSIEGVHSRM